MKFADLAQIALLGAERQAISPVVATSPLGRLQSQIDVNQREHALLSLAALSGQHERIGSLPPSDLAPLPAPAPPETQPRMNERAAALLLRMLANEFRYLLLEFLTIAAKAGVVAPPAALPGLLDVGAGDANSRELLLAIIGERGRWLAALETSWAWVTGESADDETVWQTGDSKSRIVFFGRLRRHNPARARELLAATWKDEAVKDRLLFVELLGNEFSREDEFFLETVLADKSKEVRAKASRLLAQLPGSWLLRRVTERVKPVLQFTPGTPGNVLKLKKAVPATIEIVLPPDSVSFHNFMVKEGFETVAPKGFGDRIWWIIQLLEIVPLELWTREWRVTPTQIYEASLQCEWKKELLEAWMRAAIRQKNPDWARMLFKAAYDEGNLEKVRDLLIALPEPEREPILTNLLSADDKSAREMRVPLILQSVRNWSPVLSRAVLAWMRHAAAQESHDPQLRSGLKSFVLRFAPSVLPEVANDWPTDSQWWDIWSKPVEEFISAAHFRAEIHDAFKSTN